MLSLNTTGMWSSQILDDYMKEIILKHPSNSLLREPVLLLIDSDGPHVKLANSKKYEKLNVFIKLIPPGFTPLLQPLDVAVNKYFQTTYNDMYNNYISDAISDKVLQTKSGKPKNPSHGMISDWVHVWATNFPKENIVKAFTCCVIGEGCLNEEDLHPPLKSLYQNKLDDNDIVSGSIDDVEAHFIDTDTYHTYLILMWGL